MTLCCCCWWLLRVLELILHLRTNCMKSVIQSLILKSCESAQRCVVTEGEDFFSLVKACNFSCEECTVLERTLRLKMSQFFLFLTDQWIAMKALWSLCTRSIWPAGHSVSVLHFGPLEPDMRARPHHWPLDQPHQTSVDLPHLLDRRCKAVRFSWEAGRPPS